MLETHVDIKTVRKGARVLLANGWYATVQDNQTAQHTRLVEVEGFETELGSVYSTDIMLVRIAGDGLKHRDGKSEWRLVTPTTSQVKAAAARKAAARKALGF